MKFSFAFSVPKDEETFSLLHCYNIFKTFAEIKKYIFLININLIDMWPFNLILLLRIVSLILKVRILIVIVPYTLTSLLLFLLLLLFTENLCKFSTLLFKRKKKEKRNSLLLFYVLNTALRNHFASFKMFISDRKWSCIMKI